MLQGVFLAYFVFWFFATQVWRYLAPIYAVATFLSCYTLYRWVAWMPKPTAWRRSVAGAVSAGVLCALLAVFAVNRYSAYRDDMENWDAILTEDPGYRLFQAANAHIPDLGPRLVQMGFENNIYFFNGTVIGDWFGPGRYRDMMQCAQQGCRPLESGAMRQYLDKAGSRMLAVSKAVCPGFDAADYAQDFTVLMKDDGGVLLGIRSD